MNVEILHLRSVLAKSRCKDINSNKEIYQAAIRKVLLFVYVFADLIKRSCNSSFFLDPDIYDHPSAPTPNS